MWGPSTRAIEPGREIAFLAEVAGAESRNRDERERRPVAEQADDRDDSLRPPRVVTNSSAATR